MMIDPPLVSVITIFHNEERFITEAIESILAQTFEAWELILVDDGSSDRSSEIARDYAKSMPDKIFYLEHSGHANRGMSASRNLGLANARGKYLAFVDADDVLLPTKLEAQLPLMEQSPNIGMTYCATQYWYSWSENPEDQKRDYLYCPTTEVLHFRPPDLLTAFLSQDVLMPCLGSVLVRRNIVEAVGGWEESFRGLYEDQVFFSKLCLEAEIRITPECHDLYRQHDQSCCAVSYRTKQEKPTRRIFLGWLTAYLKAKNMQDTPAWAALQGQIKASAGR
jgi:glycosyltransferase involved in cell wall biosynthesis